MRKLLSVLSAAVLVAALALPSSALALSYTGACSPTNHVGAHIQRVGFTSYNAVRGEVKDANPIADCTGDGAGYLSGTFVLPANIADNSGGLAQLGYGRLSSTDSVGFLFTPNDESVPPGLLIHINTGHAFSWNHDYRFTIEASNTGSGAIWWYTVEDLTGGWSYNWNENRHFTATNVWYQYEVYNRWDVLAAEGSANQVTISPMNYKYNGNSAWTTLTGDSNASIAWDCFESCIQPHPSFYHATAGGSGTTTSWFSAYTDAH